MLPLLAAIAAGFLAFSFMLPVVPLAVLEAGGSPSLAGATTAVFMAVTVATQLATGRAIARVGHRAVMVIATVFLGLPALVQVVSASPWVILAVSAVRGIGFGTLCVTQYALMAKLVPPGVLGRASGAIGLAAGAAQMVGLPLGLAMADSGLGYGSVYWLTALMGVVGVALCLVVPEPPREVRGGAPKASTSSGVLGLVIVPALSLTSVSMGYGAVSSFLPAAVRALDPVAGAAVAGAVLSIIGGAQMVARYLAGLYADRTHRVGALLVPGLVLAGGGIAGCSAVLIGGASSWWMVPLMVSFGCGFGLVQNEALLVMFDRVPAGSITQASTAWNVAFDAGTGTGSLALGAVAAAAGFGGAFLASAGIIAVGSACVLADFFAFRRHAGRP